MSDNPYHEQPDIDWSDLPPAPAPIDYAAYHASMYADWLRTGNPQLGAALGMLQAAHATGVPLTDRMRTNGRTTP